MRKDGQRFRERERDRERRVSAASEVEGAPPAVDAAEAHVGGRLFALGVGRRRGAEVERACLSEAEPHEAAAYSGLDAHGGGVGALIVGLGHGCSMGHSCGHGALRYGCDGRGIASGRDCEVHKRLCDGVGVGVHAERGERLFERLIARAFVATIGELICAHVEKLSTLKQQRVKALCQLLLKLGSLRLVGLDSSSAGGASARRGSPAAGKTHGARSVGATPRATAEAIAGKMLYRYVLVCASGPPARSLFTLHPPPIRCPMEDQP